MARAMARLRAGALAAAALLRGAAAASVLVVNRGPDAAQIASPVRVTVGRGATERFDAQGELELAAPAFRAPLPEVRYAVVVIDQAASARLYDTNDLQLELSASAHACSKDSWGIWSAPKTGGDDWFECLAKRTFGGVPLSFTREAFEMVWRDVDYWSLCEAQDSSPSLRQMLSSAGKRVDILRESPLVATIRGFMGGEECSDLLGLAGFDQLSMARVGTGGGSTATDENRETLSRNLFINWDDAGPLTRTAAKFFDVSSELFGERLPYEGQEPINFLHYLRGYEYKPHADGAGNKLGKRVATTLVYCQAPASGGATVFPGKKPLRFMPGMGDLLFFQYQPDPGAALHAACPVVEGNKSTLTQWYRQGVSPETPWDNFEDWGRFHNVYAKSRWKGPRYGEPASTEL